MLIQWFPGHMTKALRMMEDNIKCVDSVIYVLDSRCVMASFNPTLNKLAGNKPILYVLNKADMVEKTDLNNWLTYFKEKNLAVVLANSAGGNTANVVESLRRLNKELIERYRAKGANRSIRAMVVGIPNSGKSTLINSLCGAKRAITGDRPGVTRGKQWVSLGKGIELLDTPGTLWPSFENQTHALHLAFVGSINEDILNIEELALEMIKYFRESYPQLFLERFKLTEFAENNHETMEIIGKKRGYIMRGGVVDIERISRAIIDDFTKQKFGKIMLEIADDYR